MTTIDAGHLRAILISTRNRLALDQRDAELRAALTVALELAPNVTETMPRALLGEWLPEAMSAYDRQDSAFATAILDFLHNLPFDRQQASHWNLGYFLVMEVPRFLESFPLDNAPISKILRTFDAISQNPGTHGERDD